MNVRELRKYLGKVDQNARVLVDCDVDSYYNAHRVTGFTTRDDGTGDIVIEFDGNEHISRTDTFDSDDEG